MTTICIDTMSGSLHNILGDAPDDWTSIGCSELLHAVDEFLDISLVAHGTPAVPFLPRSESPTDSNQESALASWQQYRDW